VGFKDAKLADLWLEWLYTEHIAAVLLGGALDAEVIEIDEPQRSMEGTQRVFELRYHFSSREAFSTYETGPAPGLRAEGLRRFPPDQGVFYRRAVGAILRTFAPAARP
jgi:hypothetical protein